MAAVLSIAVPSGAVAFCAAVIWSFRHWIVASDAAICVLSAAIWSAIACASVVAWSAITCSRSEPAVVVSVAGAVVSRRTLLVVAVVLVAIDMLSLLVGAC